MTVKNYEELNLHFGHKITLARYNNESLCVECENCHEVLFEELNTVTISKPIKTWNCFPLDENEFKHISQEKGHDFDRFTEIEKEKIIRKFKDKLGTYEELLNDSIKQVITPSPKEE